MTIPVLDETELFDAADAARVPVELVTPDPSDQLDRVLRAVNLLDETTASLRGAADARAVARLVVRGARRALGAEAAVFFAASDDALTLVPVACAGVDARVLGRLPLSGGLCGWAARRSEPALVAQAPRGLQTRPGGPAAPGWMHFPLVLAPLAAGPRPVGLLALTGLDQAWLAARSVEVLRSLSRLADRVAASLAGERIARQVLREGRVERELQIARQVQQCLLSSAPPALAGFDVAGSCRPAAQVGGDFLGYRETAPGEATVTLFDVAGHGIGAAFCMTLVRSALAGATGSGTTLAAGIARANDIVHEDLAATGLYATAFLLRLREGQARAEYASAGHLEPVHWSARTRTFVRDSDGGLPLGLLARVRHPEASLLLETGDVLVSCTDGVVDARGPGDERYGRSRLLACVKRHRTRAAKDILRECWKDVSRFTRGRALDDDASLLVVRVPNGRVGETT